MVETKSAGKFHNPNLSKSCERNTRAPGGINDMINHLFSHIRIQNTQIDREVKQ